MDMDEEKEVKKNSKNKNFVKGLSVGVASTLALSFIFNGTFMSGTSKSQDINRKLFQIDTLLQHNYVDELTEEQYKDMNTNIYRGYVAGVGDRYTTYMDEEDFADFMESTNGQYAGIGASVSSDKEDNMVTIVQPFPNSPAEKAGLASGDKIISVEGENVYGDDLDAAITKLKGKEGTEVTFDVLKKATGQVETVTVTRESIDVPTIESEMLEDNVGYIRISAFDKVTTDQYKTALDQLVKDGAESLVIDLRDNPGGLLDVVSEIADTLLDEGVIVYTEDKEKNREYIYAEDGKVDLPVAVIINEYSASASEVLTCALKDHGVATVVGEQSYGKGVVQSLFPMKDGSALKITISRYYSPNGYSINDTGITPDVVVPFDEMTYGAGYNLPYEEDIQLQKAVEVLTK